MTGHARFRLEGRALTTVDARGSTAGDEVMLSPPLAWREPTGATASQRWTVLPA
jgi:hypothetical protein